MGLFDLLRPKGREIETTRSALRRAESGDDGAVTWLVQRLLDLGLDGAGPLDSAAAVARGALEKAGPDGSVEDAVDVVVRSHLLTGAAGGFVTSLGGFVTMPVALPVNVFEFYVQATRMVGAIAALRGHDITRPEIRTAVLLILIGSNADDVLARAGISTGGGGLASLALTRMPPAAMLMIDKAVGFRLLREVGTKGFSKLGRGVPVAGGFVGAALDGYMLKRIADHARREFPPVTAA